MIFIGPTDAGKGTLINYLTDPQNLKGSKNLLGYFTIKKKDDNKNKKFNISSKMVSDTKFPENEVINNRQIFDTAGFLDTRGPHDNVSNILALQHVLNLPQAKKILLCFSVCSLSE